MATIHVPWMMVAMVMGLSLTGGPVLAGEGQSTPTKWNR
jgi:hypothetical protein